MAVRNIRVIGDRMEPRRIYAGTRGSYITEVAFTFSGEWDGLTKKLIFYPVRGKPVYINYTYGSEKIPYEVMRYSGDAIMLMSGYSVETDGSLGVKIVTASAYVTVDPAESDTQNEPDIPEATEFEKIVAKLGAPYIGENGNWFVWDVYTHEFADTGLPARGEKGETGRGLTILGKYGSLDELRASVKDAQPGDAYAVGEKAPYTIYIWDDVKGDFTNHGDLRGVGITKIEQITDNTGSGEPNTIRIVTDDGAEYDYTVYNGERGHPGNIWIGETEPPDDSYTIWLNPGGAVSGFLESHQGTENAGRVLVVGEDGKVTTEEQMQADWDQYDSTAIDYVKNRTHYRNLYPALSGTLDVSDGGFFRIFDATSMSKAFKTWCSVKYMQTEELNRIMVVTAELYRSPTTEDVFTSELYSKNIGDDAVMIDSTNYYYRFKNSKYHIPLYIITDLSTLTEEYAGRFDTVGLYIDVPAEHLIKSIDAGVYYYSELSERYIPGTIARTNYVDDKIAKLKSVASTSAYTNQLPLATNTDRKTIYNGDGYIDGYRLSSSGSISAQDGMSTTGFIPATPGQVLRIKGAVPMQDKNNYLIAYNADNTVTKYVSMAYDSTGWITPSDGWMKYEDGVIIIPLTGTMFGTDFNAVRFCSAQLSDDVIVTVDEEIADAKPDWNQNDSTAPDYVKNRTHYKAQQINQTLYPTETIDVEELGAGTHLIFKPANTTPFLTIYSFTNMKYGNTCAFGYEYEYIRVSDNSYVTNSITPEGLFGNTKYKLIDSKNYSFPGVIGTVFVILDINTLTEENTKLFPEIGIYLQIQTDSTKANRTFTLKVFYMSKLSEIYIPSSIARTDYVDQKTLTDTMLTVEGAAADAKAVGDKLAEKIPAPATASVGQTIKVSAVDDNGKPTAWEAADFPEGGGGTASWTTLLKETLDGTVVSWEFADLDCVDVQVCIYCPVDISVTSAYQYVYINGVTVDLSRMIRNQKPTAVNTYSIVDGYVKQFTEYGSNGLMSSNEGTYKLFDVGNKINSFKLSFNITELNGVQILIRCR